jgi:hypothetical protein
VQAFRHIHREPNLRISVGFWRQQQIQPIDDIREGVADFCQWAGGNIDHAAFSFLDAFRSASTTLIPLHPIPQQSGRAQQSRSPGH